MLVLTRNNKNNTMIIHDKRTGESIIISVYIYKNQVKFLADMSDNYKAYRVEFDDESLTEYIGKEATTKAKKTNGELHAMLSGIRQPKSTPTPTNGILIRKKR